MPQEGSQNSFFTSPSKRGLKGLVSMNMKEPSSPAIEESFNDYDFAHRKAEEAASRRYEASEWLRKMDNIASSILPPKPSQQQFCIALRNGLILCNVLNKVNPGAVVKVVDNPALAATATVEGAAHSAIQYFENMRNFLYAVKDMQLLTFEASDLEKGGSSNKVVDCILCLKGYYEWKLSGGVGVWRYGGTVRITSLPKSSPSSSIVGSESLDDSLDESESSQYEHLLQFLHLSEEFLNEETKTTDVLVYLFDHFGLRLLQAYLRETDGIDDLPLNTMVIDTLLSKVVKDFSSLLVAQGTELGLFLKKILKGDICCLSKREFVEAISLYLNQRSSLASNDFSKFCSCGGKRDSVRQNVNYSAKYGEVINTQQKQLERMKYFFEDTKLEVKQIQSEWEQEFSRLEHHIKSLEVASTSYHNVLEENRFLYNQVQDLKGAIRVYCRVRPFLPGQSNGQSTVDYIGENGDMMIANPLKQGKDARKVFSFNKVFGTSVTQEQIYADTQPLIRSVLDGYNVCVFAYGQTGSGKTYTMSGPDLSAEETWGVNYRALRDLFYISKERSDSIKYEVFVQMIEIYNEQKNRAVGATALNERSSRSHSVLTVHVRGRELVSNSILRGCLHLVDLAGSERVDKSEAVGERLKEAQHINRSLSALGDVISALAQKSSHIPYRNSKLTQVLQDSLGGHAKTLMFVHINPELNAIGETISTLKFAERVASIELGAAQSNKETGEIRELKEEISSLKLTLERKETELEQLKAGNARNTTESPKPRAISPYRLPKYGTSGNTKPETSQRLMDDRNFEARSCSSGKQRRSRFPSALMDKESIPKMSLLTEEKLASSRKGRSPSPPVRRSTSTDRGSIIKSKLKNDTAENQPVLKHPFPARVPANKFLVTMPMASSLENNARLHVNSPEPVKNEEEQFKQALSAVRQGGVRKSKVESKAKANHHQLSPFKLQNPDLIPTFISGMEFVSEKTVETPPKSDHSDPENDLRIVESLVHGALNLNKIRQNFPKNFQNLESRKIVQGGEPLSASKVENKLLNGSGSNHKEGNNTSMPEFRRSRSTPRGKFFGLS
ncbi:kinesin protein KIN-14F [Trifolium repens]|nr:kinesin protein KIN-14F [Trifolium repens]